MKDSIVLGIDIGGSHLTAALVDETTRKFVPDSYLRVRVNSKGTAEEILGIWTKAIEDTFQAHPVANKRIGIAMPGPFDYANGISLIKGLDKYEALYKLNVKQILSQRLSISPNAILMMNDAACFLRGEVYYGAAKGYQDVIGITLGTGTGSAMHHHGVTHDANLGPAPFMDSIADEYFSTRWFVKRYQEVSGQSVKDVKALADLYPSDANVKEIFKEFVKNLAVFLEGFVNAEKPQVIVMGGNIAQCSSLFLNDLTAQLAARNITIPIVRAELGEEAAILGAASLFESKTIL
ncbi:MAG TPA: ROK family protein [Cyclobacteriaceae bacterium]|nr:ROK family protein [Cyclobacteriaceae bacterium]HMV09145.1 ROK family protein [Cyclobacteriaceae bacterium]HMV91602.1 ROK family protein [Cyclobacteriaceae bacterium]HMX01486.1 ROK family protein [Cyclobacteriaceae bacterium]HMX50244.1 ROK family protein [Cyclobacteriaceae bacterium]